MTLFEWLLVGHLVGDFLLQNRWMAEKKTRYWVPLLIHCSVYTLAVSLLALSAGGISWTGIVLIFAAHIILDRRKFVDFWANHITNAADIPWLKIMIDQSWHLVVLAAATLV